MSHRRPFLSTAVALAALTWGVAAPRVTAQEPETLPLSWENTFTRSTGVPQVALSPKGSAVAVTAGPWPSTRGGADTRTSGSSPATAPRIRVR